MPGERLPMADRGREGAQTCISDDLLFRYLDGVATPDEVRAVQKHLSECKFCFNLVAAVAKDSLHHPNEAEWREFEKTVPLNPEKQVAGILSHVHELFPADSRSLSEATEKTVTYKPVASPLMSIWESLRKWFETPKLAPRYALAFVVLLAVIAGSFWGIRFYQTSYRLEQAKRLLRDNYRVYMADAPRLSGGYESTGISTLMAAGESPATQVTYLDRATALVKTAGVQSVEAQQLLAQILIIKNNYAQADSLLKHIQPEATKSATILNDLGVLYFAQGSWDTAAHYFEAAITTDPQFPEARYNLALAKARLGATLDAIAILNQYLDLEANEGWRNAAMAFRDKLLQEDNAKNETPQK
ncbi:MAG: tetratricopeptide repeat protein [candidate division KSB1 bacterium]|nr:tetratricopeptide repeat protein [candidate division KSB1 bacterium]MDZ7301286.1 tetratricopeptide repeat protein [candidate division KSB1 bacterium]MDZ7310829.1 tetratricopeptide repeat protein [candidate division KSB1 bacterium]